MAEYGDAWESPVPVAQSALQFQVTAYQPRTTSSAFDPSFGWKNNLINGMIEPERRSAPVSSGMITKPLNHEKLHDMRHDRFEVINDNSRQSRMKFNDKYRYAKHRPISFLPQE